MWCHDKTAVDCGLVKAAAAAERLHFQQLFLAARQSSAHRNLEGVAPAPAATALIPAPPPGGGASCWLLRVCVSCSVVTSWRCQVLSVCLLTCPRPPSLFGVLPADGSLSSYLAELVTFLTLWARCVFLSPPPFPHPLIQRCPFFTYLFRIILTHFPPFISFLLLLLSLQLFICIFLSCTVVFTNVSTTAITKWQL